MSFSFDKSYWSAGPRDEPQYASQQTLYNDLGQELLEHGFAGFNACILTCKSDPTICELSLMLHRINQTAKQVLPHPPLITATAYFIYEQVRGNLTV